MRDVGYYFGIFWKILCSKKIFTTFIQSFIAMAYWDMIYEEGPFHPPSPLPPRVFHVKKRRLVMVNSYLLYIALF